MSKGRLEAFSDGVFAIVITLLILDVHAPSTTEATLETLWPLLPHVAAFVLSFIIVGVYWVAHHHMLHFIKLVDRELLWLNLLLLLCVVFIPFPTSLLAAGFTNPLAIRLYGLALIATNCSGLFLWWYATSQQSLVVPEVNREFARWVAVVHASPIAAYVLAVGVAGREPALSLALFVAVPLFFIVPNPYLRRRLRSMTRI
jgi:uncharacterized membrane protein